ncbi:Wzz/FepE/Etk N-terminal domain-containing protein [Rhodobacter capsulatus]|uniref:Wzz/FepE/Etk N-terminal domain-containing protein n=1 Tax=Rhodobacter capsulatus TaxID=1061 RepID=UPI004038FB19
MNAPHTHAERPAPEDEMIDLAQGLRTLRAGWRTIAAGFAVAVALGLLYAQFLATPVYTARATVVLETRKPQVIDLEGMMGGLTGSSDELNTEVEVLRSRGVAEKVVAELDLAADPEFNATLGAPSLRARLRGLFGAAAAPDPAAIRAGGGRCGSGPSFGAQPARQLCLRSRGAVRRPAKGGADRRCLDEALYRQPDRGEVRGDRTGDGLAGQPGGRAEAPARGDRGKGEILQCRHDADFRGFAGGAAGAA